MVTTETLYTPNQLYSVPLAELQSDTNQPRKYLDPQALEELTASVVQHGILEPILFRKAQAKAAAPSTRTAAKTSPAKTMVDALETVGTKVSALDFGTFSGEDVQLMSNAMTGLQTTLEETIARIPK